MIGWVAHVILRHYLREGLTKGAIAERLGISRKTVTGLGQSGDRDRDLEQRRS